MISPVLRRLGLVVVLACACSPAVDAGALEVAVGPTTRTLTTPELTRLPQTTVVVNEHSYTGTRLRELFGVETPGLLRASAADGYSQTLAADVIGRDDVLLAWMVDGDPLPAGEGPLRLVVPGSPGLSIKRLVRLGQP